MVLERVNKTSNGRYGPPLVADGATPTRSRTLVKGGWPLVVGVITALPPIYVVGPCHHLVGRAISVLCRMPLSRNFGEERGKGVGDRDALICTKRAVVTSTGTFDDLLWPFVVWRLRA